MQIIAFVALFLGNVLEKEKGEWAAQLLEVWSCHPKIKPLHLYRVGNNDSMKK